MADIALRLWSDQDLWLLHSANTVEMTAHLNGPETDAEVADRHSRYLRYAETGDARMFVILQGAQAVGSIGYWHLRWREQDVFETGWFVLPKAQGQGLARRALALLLDDVRGHRGDRRLLVAFPETDNPASNAVCRGAGFRLLGTATATFRGADLVMNEWVLELTERVAS
jgi:RimJ/RimL family protein N-acetyltransferase